MKLQESGEMYLETILLLSLEHGKVRSIDVANRTGYSKPSVSHAVNLLKDNGYIVIDSDGSITLTEEGRAVAQRMYERHTLLTSLLIRMGVSEQTAAADACRIEHDISEETFEKLRIYVQSL